MEIDPASNKNLSEHDAKLVVLATNVEALFTERQVPQHVFDEPEIDPERYQILTLGEDELATASAIFEGHVMDAPKKVEITFGGSYQGLSAPEGLDKPKEFLMFAIQSNDDVKSCYSVWLNYSEAEPVVVMKTVDRNTEVIQPHVVAKDVSSPAVHVERVSKDKHLESYELEALSELVEALHGLSPVLQQPLSDS